MCIYSYIFVITQYPTVLITSCDASCLNQIHIYDLHYTRISTHFFRRAAQSIDIKYISMAQRHLGEPGAFCFCLEVVKQVRGESATWKPFMVEMEWRKRKNGRQIAEGENKDDTRRKGKKKGKELFTYLKSYSRNCI